MPNDNKKHSIHTPKQVAEKLQHLIDKDNNLPRCNCASCGGTQVGSGIFTPHMECITTHIHNIRKHPKEDKYTYPMGSPEMQAYAKSLIEKDEDLSPQDKQSILDTINNPIDLDETWNETKLNP